MSQTTSATDPEVLKQLTRIADSNFGVKNAIVALTEAVIKAAAGPQLAITPTAGLTLQIPPGPPAALWMPPTIADGQVIALDAGTYQQSGAIAAAVTIKGAGMRLTKLDGQGGIGAGHRLAWGKGIIHAAAPITVQDVGIINGGGADNNSDAEAGIYAEGFAGKLHLLRVAFDSCEDGVFTPNQSLGAVDLVIESSVFGRAGANGLADGRSHDVYVSGKSVTILNSVFCGTSRGNTIKCRGPKLDVSGSYIGRTNGRWIDAPGGTVITSSGNTYVTLPGCEVQNAFGLWDEADDTANPGQPGSFSSVNDTFYFSRAAGEHIWINNPSATVQFTGAKVFWIGAAGATPPVVIIDGPGALSGVNPFVFNEANRVNSAPLPPADPTP